MGALSLDRILAVSLLLALGFGSSGAEEGVDKLSAQEIEKLDGLRLDYDLAREEITQKQWAEPMEKLRKGYRERMQKIQDSFAQKGDLQKALTARDAGKNDPTEATLNTSVKEIAHVQKIFLEAEKQMQKRLQESLLELARSYVEKLTTIKDKLTQINRLDAAIFVDESIQKVVAEMGMQTVNELRRTSLIPGGSNITQLGLVAYYPFNGNARDESRNRNDGKVNGATLTTDRHGRSSSAFHFDGLDDFITVDSSPELRALLSISVSTWVRVYSSQSPAPNNNHAILASWSGGGDGRAFWLGTGNNASHFAVGSGPENPHGDLFNSRDTKITDGVWHHVVYAHDLNGADLYIDGKSIVTSEVGFPLKPFIKPLIFGADNNGIRANFTGYIDDIRIYNRALSDKEVRAIYDSEKPRG